MGITEDVDIAIDSIGWDTDKNRCLKYGKNLIVKGIGSYSNLTARSLSVACASLVF